MADYICPHCTNFSCQDCRDYLAQMSRADNQAPYALTDSHVAALEEAIRAEGYDILYDTETGEFKLLRTCGADSVPRIRLNNNSSPDINRS